MVEFSIAKKQYSVGSESLKIAKNFVNKQDDGRVFFRDRQKVESFKN